MFSPESFFYVAVIGVGLFVVGRAFRDFTVGMFGGLLCTILGLVVLIDGVYTFPSLLNDFVGSGLVGLGGYVMIVGGIELIKTYGG